MLKGVSYIDMITRARNTNSYELKKLPSISFLLVCVILILFQETYNVLVLLVALLSSLRTVKR